MHQALEHAIKSVFDLGMEKVKEGLKARNFGLGVNDELLFLSACYIAQSELNVSSEGILLVCRALDTLAPGDRKRVVRMIGSDEQERNIKEPATDKSSGAPLSDKKGNPLYKETKIIENTRGAQIVKMLADLNDIEKIVLVFKSVGADGQSFNWAEKILEVSKNAVSKVKSSNIVQGIKNNTELSLSSLEQALNNSAHPVRDLINLLVK